jgi:hypothetical protein
VDDLSDTKRLPASVGLLADQSDDRRDGPKASGTVVESIRLNEVDGASTVAGKYLEVEQKRLDVFGQKKWI